MAVEHSTDLPQPAKPFNHKKDLGFASQVEKEDPLTNQSPVPGCFVLYASLKLMVASGAFSQSRIVDEIWVALTRSRTALASDVLLLEHP